MKNIVDRLEREARILSVECSCDKKGCGNCWRRKLMWEAKKEIVELRKHPESINKIVKENPAVDVKKLQQNIKMLQDLKQVGIKIGPNYNLESPYARPEPKDNQVEPRNRTIRLKHKKE